MKSEIILMRRAATIAGNTRCWIGIGCVVAKEGKILVEAWNETLPGEKYCQAFRKRRTKRSDLSERSDLSMGNAGCIRHDLGLNQGNDIVKVCSIHAEALAIARAAQKGIALHRAVMFVTSFPCLICMRSVTAAGIKKVVYMNDFYKPHHLSLFEDNGVAVSQLNESLVWKS